MAAITNGQLEIAGSLIVGDGTEFRLPQDWVQWWHAPDVRTSDIPRTSAAGFVFGRDLLNKQVTTISVLILGASEDELASNIDQWKTACQSTSDSLVTIRSNLLGRTRQRFGRFRVPGDVTVDYWSRDHGDLDPSGCAMARAYGNAQFEAVDPHTYGDVINTYQTTIASPGAGVTMPFTLPITLPVSTTGSINFVNNGDAPTVWSGRFDGPITNPRITHVQSGAYLDFSANDGLNLVSGQWVDLNLYRRLVLFNGTADYRTKLTVQSQWFDLDPGTNTSTFNATAGSGTFTIGAYDAFYS
jgi:hypothetical protein